MEKLRSSTILKILCYILIPIIAAILFFSIFHLSFLNEYGDTKSGTKYFESEQFANEYFYFVINRLGACNREKNGESTNFVEINEEGKAPYYYTDYRITNNYYLGIPAYVNFIIVDKQTGTMYTNIKSEDYEKEKQNMKNEKIYWNYVDENVDTNISYLDNENIKYNYNFIYAMEKQTDTSYSISEYDIYTSCDVNNVEEYSAYGLNETLYTYMLENRTKPIYATILSLGMLLVITIYLFWSIGHKEGEEGISLNSIDRVPYEILVFICLMIFSIALATVVNIGGTINYVVLLVGVLGYLVCYAMCAIIGVTTIKRIKAKRFIKSFLIYKIGKWCFDKLKILFDTLDEKTTENKKLFWYYILFIIVSIMLACLFYTGIAIILLIGFWIWSYYKIKKYIINQEKIKKALKEIYEGKNDVRLNEDELRGTLKEMAVYVNDIASGFSNAINESLKSERLKTELITNVSHDIKTPLTSIINYVDLLKKENLQDEKVKKYIEILDQKSQRLKKLTEDLVEASKVSSGNVKLNFESIDIKELFNQTIGEFKDRFEEKGLKIEVGMPEDDIKIKADSRYLYRIIENLFGNITKYALEGSRVYIDIVENNKNKDNSNSSNNYINISIKNISKEKLNISSDELMQRFVRGDKSRYTEGSGLGLSIAKSLTELQGGKFNIIIDGDLFKVEINWPI